MAWSRRNFLATLGVGASATTIAHIASSVEKVQAETRSGQPADWENLRELFNLDPAYIHLAGLLITSHPVPVQRAIEQYQVALNTNPATFVQGNNADFQAEVRRAAASYMETEPNHIALTDSTTMGTALMINGLSVRPNQELLTTEYDYYSTHESLNFKAARSGVTVRNIPLFQSIHTISVDEMVNTLIAAIRPETRLVTATWVHSSTGLKVPIRQIADRLADINVRRDPDDQVLLFVDGVHGFGVEATAVSELNCDFFAAGTHKWMFAPRGTGILWGNPRSQAAVTPTIPTFTRRAGWGGWMTPGGFKPFEHLWAMTQAFKLHQQLGKSQVANHIHTLSRQLKEGLAQMPHITLYTPIDPTLSAGIVCFDVAGMRPSQVVDQLQNHQIIASTTPYTPSYARLTPGVYNTVDDIEHTLRVIHNLG